MTAAEYQQHKTSTTNLSASNINLIVTKEKSIYTFASTKYRQKYLELDWRDELKNNDILITKSGDLRVIREAVYYNDECLSHIVLAIRKCSWTRSPTTSYDRSALKTLKFRKAAVKFKPSEKDNEFQEFVLRGKYSGFYEPEYGVYTCISAKSFA
jgi:hypothetical protein